MRNRGAKFAKTLEKTALEAPRRVFDSSMLTIHRTMQNDRG